MVKKLTALTLGLCLSMSALAVDVATLTKQAENGSSNNQTYIDISIAKEWFGKACDDGDQKGCDNYRQLNEQGY